MTDPHIENLVLAWLALDAGPADAPRPFGAKARDGLLDTIADYFSVKPTPLAAYLRAVTDPTAALTSDARFTFRHKLQLWANARATSVGATFAADVRSRVFLSDLARVRGEQYVDVLTPDNTRLATLRRHESMTDDEAWVSLIGNVLGAYVAGEIEIQVRTDAMPAALPVDLGDHPAEPAAALAKELAEQMEQRAVSIGKYRAERRAVARRQYEAAIGGRLDGREGLIAAVGTMEERINENLKEQLGKPWDEIALKDVEALFGFDAIARAAGFPTHAGDKGTMTPAQAEEVIKNTPQPEGME